MTRLMLFIGIVFTIQCFGQTPRNNSLLVAEYQKNEEGVGNYAHLVSYNFIAGKLTSKDTVFSAPTTKGQHQGPYVRYDQGHNFVYQNRYVISGIGNVIDVQTKSLVMEERDHFIETRGDSIIFHRNNGDTGAGYLICDLKNRTYDFVKDRNFLIVKGLNSPNHKMGLAIDKSEIPYKIVLYNQDNKKEVIVNNCGAGTLLSTYSSRVPNVPLHWINNHDFLYATYSSPGHRMDGEIATVTIHQVNINTKNSKIVAKIDSVPPAISNSGFSTNLEQKIIFYCSKGQFVIDHKEKTATAITMSSVGNDFSIENNINEEYGSIITFQEKEIGRVWCIYSKARTTTGFLAVEYGEISSNLGYPKGVKVWNDETKEWFNIDIPWLSALIGWIEN